MTKMHSSSRFLRLVMIVIALVLSLKSASLFAAVSGLNHAPSGSSGGTASTEARVVSGPADPSAAGQGEAGPGRPPAAQRISPTNGRSLANGPQASAGLQSAAPAQSVVPTLTAASGNSSPDLTRNTGSPVAAAPAREPSSSGASASEPGRNRMSQLDERERTVAEREAVAAATEKRLSDRVSELASLQARLQALQTTLQDRDDANWAGLVKLYESMRPRDAAAIFNALDKNVLLELLDRMKPAKASPVLAAMDPEKARQVTADLAAKRTQSIAVLN